MIFAVIAPGRPSLDQCGALDRHPPRAADTRWLPMHEAVKRKVWAALGVILDNELCQVCGQGRLAWVEILRPTLPARYSPPDTC
jgi:hypothetical protein